MALDLGKIKITWGGTWDKNKEYEELTVVDNAYGVKYISKVDVPAGIDIHNTDYWTPLSGNFNEHFQGALDSEPNKRIDGSPLQVGDMFFNTDTGRIEVYNGEKWEDVYKYFDDIQKEFDSVLATLTAQQEILSVLADNEEFLKLKNEIENEFDVLSSEVRNDIDTFKVKLENTSNLLEKRYIEYKNKIQKLIEENEKLKNEILKHIDNFELFEDTLTKLAIVYDLNMNLMNEQINHAIEEINNMKTKILDLVFEHIDNVDMKLTNIASVNSYGEFIARTILTSEIFNSGILSTPYGNRFPGDDPSKIINMDIGFSALAIHNHPNYARMPGMGWFRAVVNGMIFQTRHNDYRMYRRKQDGNTEQSIAPKFGSEITGKSFNDQIKIIKDLFDRYHEGKLTSDEKKYFRWDLAYAEVWLEEIGDPTGTVTDTFSSFRHGFNPTSAINLIKKIAYMTLTGKKSRFENIPYNQYIQMDNGKYYALKYRILVAPIESLNGKQWYEFLDNKDLILRDYRDFNSSKTRFLMKEPHKIVSNVKGMCKNASGIKSIKTIDNYVVEGIDNKDLSYYHLRYKIGKDAVNMSSYVNGWCDSTLFVAYNDNDKIYGNVSYMLPLEFILRTPLEEYNPHNIEHGSVKGSGTKTNPYTAWNENKYNYKLPAELVLGENIGTTVADTGGRKYMKGADGKAHLCYASGIYVILPKIGSYKTRIRFPVYYSAFDYSRINIFVSNIQKEISLLNDSVLALYLNQKLNYN